MEYSRGVRWDSYSNRWVSEIEVDGKVYGLGDYKYKKRADGVYQVALKLISCSDESIRNDSGFEDMVQAVDWLEYHSLIPLNYRDKVLRNDNSDDDRDGEDDL